MESGFQEWLQNGAKEQERVSATSAGVRCMYVPFCAITSGQHNFQDKE